MKNVNGVKTAGLLLLAVSLFLVSGCGYKNQPIPPENVVPRPIQDLRYSISDKGAILNWSYPVATIKNTAITKIDSFELFLAEIPLDEYCGNCPIPFTGPIDLAGGESIDGELRKVGSYDFSDLRSAHKYFFKIRSRTSWWASSDDSNIVTFTWFEPAAAPEKVKATPGDREIRLQWDSVTKRLDGQPVKMPVKYQVLRSVGGKDFEKIGEPLAATSFTDRQVRNGQKYFYTVQSLLVHEDEYVSGGVSKEVTATPVDMTPPLPPQGVTAVWTDSGVKIFWDQSSTADIGGYRVYRRDADRDSYQLLGNVAPAYTIFVDSKAEEDKRYYWAVTAIDKAKPANESNKSREATIRH